MGKNVFLVNIARCNGCHDCQVACKDEHCGTAWLPYAAEQPDTGQFWCKVEETTHGTVPKVNVTYQPSFGAQDEAIREYAPEALMDRDDGLIVLDPAKCKGRKDIADKFDGVFWNEELEICQGCTGCAHLLDDGWDVPRCVDACATGALTWVDEDELPEDAERLTPGSHVYYLALPKRWVAGEVYDEVKDEVIIGASVTIRGADGTVKKTQTDEFGDFWFRQIPGQTYDVWFEKDGYVTRTGKADATDADVNMGSISLYTMNFK